MSLRKCRIFLGSAQAERRQLGQVPLPGVRAPYRILLNVLAFHVNDD